MEGVRATVTFSNPGDCPIAACSTTSDSPIEHVSHSIALAAADGSTTEFLVRGEVPDRDDIEPTFEYGTATLYRTTHGDQERCPCECLGGHGCPIHRLVAEDGALTVVFHAAEFETLQDVMQDLREAYAPVDVKRLLQPPLQGSPEERVFVNRGALTDRQLEVLSTAYEMGYFERPKRANASDVAAAIDISQSTLTEHLMAAQSKLLDDFLD